MKCIYNW